MYVCICICICKVYLYVYTNIWILQSLMYVCMCICICICICIWNVYLYVYTNICILQGAILCLASSLEGCFLISGSRDSTAKVWNCLSGQCLKTSVHLNPKPKPFRDPTPKPYLYVLLHRCGIVCRVSVSRLFRLTRGQ